MSHEYLIKYIKSQFKNMHDDKIKSLERPIRSNLKKKYKLKSHILHEYCTINSIDEFNRLLTAENKEFINEIGEIDEYMLKVDNKYFDEIIYISDDIKIIPIRIEKNINKKNEDDDDDKDTSNKIKITSIEKGNHCGYILYETSDKR